MTIKPFQQSISQPITSRTILLKGRSFHFPKGVATFIEDNHTATLCDHRNYFNIKLILKICLVMIYCHVSFNFFDQNEA